MKLDLTYLPTEDRMCLAVRDQADWLLTRSLLLKLVSAWIQQLQAIDLPKVGFALGDRNIGQEHALSLEFDGPQLELAAKPPAAQNQLVLEVSLTVDATGSVLVLRGASLHTQLNLTRKESHIVLEMLAEKARAVQWLQAVDWPSWLGATAGL